jgi:hypothetical protein
MDSQSGDVIHPVARSMMCINCYLVSLSDAVNQPVRPAKHVQVAHAQVIFVRVIHALPVCESEDLYFIMRFIRILHFLSIR